MSGSKKKEEKKVRIAKTVYLDDAGNKKVYADMERLKITNFSLYVNKKLGLISGKQK